MKLEKKRQGCKNKEPGRNRQMSRNRDNNDYYSDKRFDERK